MKVFIDAPLFIYLNTLADFKYRVSYENFYIEVLNEYKAYSDALVLDELIYISKKKYGVPYDISINFVESTVLPYITILNLGENEFKYASKMMEEYNLKPSDAFHIGVMINNNINKLVSEDHEFDKMPIVKRLWF